MDLIADFINTLDKRDFGDHAGKSFETREAFRRPEQLEAWLLERGLGQFNLDEQDVGATRSLREYLRAQLAGRDRLAVPVARIGELASPRLSYEIGFNEGGIVLMPVGKRASFLQWLAREISEASATRAWSRLKVCASTDCQWVFVDRSRNSLGRWCSMRSCGNRHKVRTYRQNVGEVQDT